MKWATVHKILVFTMPQNDFLSSAVDCQHKVQKWAELGMWQMDECHVVRILCLQQMVYVLLSKLSHHCSCDRNAFTNTFLMESVEAVTWHHQYKSHHHFPHILGALKRHSGLWNMLEKLNIPPEKHFTVTTGVIHQWFLPLLGRKREVDKKVCWGTTQMNMREAE